MSFLTRFVLRTWLPQILWAVDTPLEPLFSGRKRAVPVLDDEINQETVALLDSHTYLAARMVSRWLLSGAALIVGVLVMRELFSLVVGSSVGALSVLLHSSDEQFARAISVNYSIYAIVSIGALVAWLVWGAVEMTRMMGAPVSALDNRLIVSLKRGVAGPRTLALLEALPADSAYRLYLAPVLKRASRRA